MRNYVQVLGFDIVSRGLLAGLNILLIRWLSPAELSTLTIAMTVVSTVAQTLAWPINRLYVLADGADGEVQVARRYLGAQLFGTAIVAVAALPASPYLNGTYPAALLLAAAMTATEFAKTFYQKRLNFLAFSLAEVVRTLLLCGAVGAMVWAQKLTANGMLLAQGAANCSIAALMLGRIGLLRLPVAASLKLLGSIFRSKDKYLLGYFVVLAIFPNVQPAILKATSTDLVIATYGSAFRFYTVLLMALAAVHVVLLPTLQAAKSVEEIRKTVRLHVRVTVLFAAGILLVAVCAQWVIPWIDKGRYPQAIPTFRILCLSSVISFAFSPYINVLLVRNDHRAIFAIILVGLIVNGGMSVVLIERYGAVGAAIGTLVSYGIVNAWVAVRAARKFLAPALSPLPSSGGGPVA